ncbi:hypothetical protein Clow_00076 [Corynebacterium lowii]|uniref:Uncharacterized protein n=1 Tax=Corynebacterium lowii TaxID=1544413 RepID=A0A0Q0UFV9_9CORY|nr:hypothetical protein Clow_00076 [Corynebacterium lowii]MDP9852388.1 hypothetical protein [Corynebacterium lowii]
MAKPPGNAVAYHSIPDGFRHNKAYPRPALAGNVHTAIVLPHVQDESTGTRTLTMFNSAPELHRRGHFMIRGEHPAST